MNDNMNQETGVLMLVDMDDGSDTCGHEELLRMAEEELRKQEEEKQAILSNLAQEIQGKFTERCGRRSTKEREWIESMRLYLGSLSSYSDSDKEHPLNTGAGSRKPRHNLVKTKCAVAIAKSVSSQFAGGDMNWSINSSPSLEADPEQNERAAKALQQEILNQLEEINYAYRCRQAMQDRVILGTGIMKGPLPSKDARLTYIQETNPDSGEMILLPDYRVLNKPVVYRVDPWMFFPDDTVSSIEDAEDAIELHPMSRLQLSKLKRNPGFFSEAIDAVLQNTPESYTNSTFSEYSSLTAAGVNFLKDKYAVLERHGPISVSELGALGISPSYDNRYEDMFFGEVWVCQGIVIRAELETISGLCELPYSVCPWESDPNSIFGFGLPQTIKDPQRIAQIALDMILENSSVSSGPIGVVNTAYIEPYDGNYELLPNKLFKTTDYTLSSIDQTMKFFSVPNLSDKIFPVLQFAREAANEEAAMPMFPVEGARAGPESATGLGIVEQSETVVSDFKSEEWDDKITEPLINRMFHWNMQYNARPEIVGDFTIDVKTSTEYRNKRLFVRDVEKLSVESAQNPALAAVINQEGLQRARLQMMHIPPGNIIKTDEQIAKEQQEQSQNPPPPDPVLLRAEADMAKIEVDKERLALERDKLAFEREHQQRREEYDHAERMGANYMRELESQARIMEAMAQREIEMMKLAQKENSDSQWIMAELQKSQLQADVQKFQAGLDSQSKFRDQALYAAEMKMKREIGSGV